jgi:hypothetical protein
MVILLSPNTIDPLRVVCRFSITGISVIVSPLGLVGGMFPILPSEDSDIRLVYIELFDILPCVLIELREELKVAAATRVMIDEFEFVGDDMGDVCSVFVGEFVYIEVTRNGLLVFSGGRKNGDGDITVDTIRLGGGVITFGSAVGSMFLFSANRFISSAKFFRKTERIYMFLIVNV